MCWAAGEAPGCFYVKTLIDELGDFVNNVYFQDVCAIGACYKEWTAYGAGINNYLSVPEFPDGYEGNRF